MTTNTDIFGLLRSSGVAVEKVSAEQLGVKKPGAAKKDARKKFADLCDRELARVAVALKDPKRMLPKPARGEQAWVIAAEEGYALSPRLGRVSILAPSIDAENYDLIGVPTLEAAQTVISALRTSAMNGKLDAVFNRIEAELAERKLRREAEKESTQPPAPRADEGNGEGGDAGDSDNDAAPKSETTTASADSEAPSDTTTDPAPTTTDPATTTDRPEAGRRGRRTAATASA